jgi:hypothetical protein
MHVGRVFLSHTSADKPLVRRLAEDLRQQNVGVWYDEWELKVGDSIVGRIEDGIREAGFLAVVLSPKSIESQWVRRELNAALAAELERRSVFILPVLARDCEIPLFLRDKLYADFRYDYADGLRAILRTVSPGACTPPKLIFDSIADDPAFVTLGVHFSDEHALKKVRLAQEDGSSWIMMSASSNQTVGVNKSVPTLHGRAEFEYRIETASMPGNHVYFAMIPIQETGYHRSGVIEVGGYKQADSRNPTSPHRIRFEIPYEHQVDRQWHIGTIDFDFRDTQTAFYSIFAGRINEGAQTPRSGGIALRRLRIYSW